MRIKINMFNIIEAYDVDVTIGGSTDETKKHEFKEMSAFLTVRSHTWPDEEWEAFGEFDVSDCFTEKDAEKKIQKFLDDLLVNGYVDISTDKKCEEYHLIVY